MATTNENNELLDTKKEKSYIISIIVFSLCALISIWLFTYNTIKTKSISKINTEITTLQWNIDILKKDENISTYLLVKANIWFLDKYKKLSQIPSYIEYIENLTKTYWVNFNWFNYASGLINLTAIINGDNSSTASTKLNKFLNHYRDTKKDYKDIFSLDEISSFKWQTWISFDTKFKLN